MLTPAGVVKLMDFGIARSAADHKLTQTGTTVGSLYYMSPEQIQGVTALDARSRPLFGGRLALRTGDRQAAVRWRQPVRHHVGASAGHSGPAGHYRSATAAAAERRDSDGGGERRRTRGFRPPARCATRCPAWCAEPKPAAAARAHPLPRPPSAPCCRARRPTREGRAAGKPPRTVDGAGRGGRRCSPSWPSSQFAPKETHRRCVAQGRRTCRRPTAGCPTARSATACRRNRRAAVAAQPEPHLQQPRAAPSPASATSPHRDSPQSLAPQPPRTAVCRSRHRQPQPAAGPAVRQQPAAAAASRCRRRPPPLPDPAAPNCSRSARASRWSDVRAAGIRSSLQTLQRSQAASGLNLRGDMQAAANLMNSYLDGADAALNAGDVAAGQELSREGRAAGPKAGEVPESLKLI